MLTPSIKKLFKEADEKLAFNPKLRDMFKHCFADTLETTTKIQENGESFVITGDIPAMWLRDSSAQVHHYLPLVKEDEELQKIIEGLIARQARCICIDGYANAFNESTNNNRTDYDRTELNAWIWERKYEVDSLCYPIDLAYKYWKQTGKNVIFTDMFKKAVNIIIDIFTIEQRHNERSNYRFVRDWAVHHEIDTETLQNDGWGTPVNYTGMTWSGFRPSDDACTFGYLIPSNMFAYVILGYIAEFAKEIWKDEYMQARVKTLRHAIGFGIRNYGTYLHPKYGRIYAYETDGFGNYNLMDDANVPSLLSAPYLGYTTINDPIYQNTRRFILSRDNPYFFEGKYVSGVGSPHTKHGYVWHIALTMQALTASTREEQIELIDKIIATDAGCGCMHESFDPNDPSKFSRSWFAWANSIFSELVYKVYLE